MTKAQPHKDSRTDSPYDPVAVGGLYRSVSMVGIGVATTGVLAELYVFGEIQHELWSSTGVFGAALSGDPSAFTTLGIWILIAGPILALCSMMITGIQKRSPTNVILSAVVLAVIILSIPIKLWLEGGG